MTFATFTPSSKGAFDYAHAKSGTGRRHRHHHHLLLLLHLTSTSRPSALQLDELTKQGDKLNEEVTAPLVEVLVQLGLKGASRCADAELHAALEIRPPPPPPPAPQRR